MNRYYFTAHSNEPNFLRKYIVVGCSQTFQSYSSYNSHLLRKHNGKDFESEARETLLSSGYFVSGETTVNSSLRDSSSGPRPVADFTLTNMETEMETTEVSDEGELGDLSLVEDHLSNSDRLHRSAALLLLTAKERYQLTSLL